MNTDKLMILLFNYFIIALIFETAMSVIFKWRFFLERWNNKGLKTVILVVVAYLLTVSLNLNIFKELLPILNNETIVTTSNNNIEMFLTALFIAGGSGNIYELIKNTKIRDTKRNNDITKKANLKKNKNNSTLNTKTRNSNSENSIAKSNYIKNNRYKRKLIRKYIEDIKNI